MGVEGNPKQPKQPIQGALFIPDGAYGHMRPVTGQEPSGKVESQGLPEPGSTPQRATTSGKDAAAGDNVELPG